MKRMMNRSVPQAIQDLQTLDTKRGIFHIALDWAGIAGVFAICAVVDHVAVYALAILPIAAFQHALAIIGHDGVHGLLHPNRKINRWMTNLLCMWPLGMSAEGYGPWHFRHHRYLGTEQDPEVQIKKGRGFELPKPRGKIALGFLRDLVGGGLSELIHSAKEFKPKEKIHQIAPTLFLLGLTGVFWLLGSIWIPLLWVASTMVAFWAFFRVRVYSEHSGTTDTLRFAGTRLGKALFFPHNTDHHYEHHTWPFVPFYNLPEARRLSAELELGPQVMSQSELFDYLETGEEKAS